MPPPESIPFSAPERAESILTTDDLKALKENT